MLTILHAVIEQSKTCLLFQSTECNSVHKPNLGIAPYHKMQSRKFKVSCLQEWNNSIRINHPPFGKMNHKNIEDTHQQIQQERQNISLQL